eukprot:gnl/Chilomastix_cuspidata/4345.p2 GENE.gnl/Chilomastix_cuspidata/4345~~gnl/Chilomastix_cuspidata/4345.p2  ORF type:complete len:186 (+),score=91.67 gnl/Chilomastix_cuspidata/4345:235-792(+)
MNGNTHELIAEISALIRTKIADVKAKLAELEKKLNTKEMHLLEDISKEFPLKALTGVETDVEAVSSEFATFVDRVTVALGMGAEVATAAPDVKMHEAAIGINELPSMILNIVENRRNLLAIFATAAKQLAHAERELDAGAVDPQQIGRAAAELAELQKANARLSSSVLTARSIVRSLLERPGAAH